ncbi:MAG: HAD-IIIC family phosphatase [Bacteroidales bacterium]|jgi:FkbH-like protein
MYETEIYNKTVRENLPDEILNQFINTLNSINSRSILHWTEHCTECSMPACFKTCDFYSPRIDGKCQRFVNGIEKMAIDSVPSISLLKIYFKKWGAFATQGNNELFDIEKARLAERNDLRISSLIHLPWPAFIKKKLAQKRYSVKKKHIIKIQNTSNLIPDAFLVEIYNPSYKTVYLNLTIRNEDDKYKKIPFQYNLKLNSGYNKEIIPFNEIDKRIKTKISYRISFIPENIAGNIPLYFGLTEFVQFKNAVSSVKKSQKIKCIVWDLDNTIWDGVLIEVGYNKLKLKPNIKEILIQLENKGVLHSIASKNSFELVMEALHFFDIDHFFLFPQISWIPKSLAIKEIANDIDIGLEAILFIDDSIFEREEVQTALPQVTVMDALKYNDLLKMEAFQVPVTAESINRKQMYLVEAKRKENLEQYDGEYLDFLKSCDIELELLPLIPEHFDRVYELTQRTNQMNFSGNRYQKEDIELISNNDNLDIYVLRCSDKYGEYGIIGLAIINKAENRLIDLMFSCRIQSKRIEHAFMTFCLQKYLKDSDFFVTYKRTEKNKFSAQVFQDFGFELEKQEGALHHLIFPLGKTFIDDQIVKIK